MHIYVYVNSTLTVSNLSTLQFKATNRKLLYIKVLEKHITSSARILGSVEKHFSMSYKPSQKVRSKAI